MNFFLFGVLLLVSSLHLNASDNVQVSAVQGLLCFNSPACCTIIPCCCKSCGCPAVCCCTCSSCCKRFAVKQKAKYDPSFRVLIQAKETFDPRLNLVRSTAQDPNDFKQGSHPLPVAVRQGLAEASRDVSKSARRQTATATAKATLAKTAVVLASAIGSLPTIGSPVSGRSISGSSRSPQPSGQSGALGSPTVNPAQDFMLSPRLNTARPPKTQEMQ